MPALVQHVRRNGVAYVALFVALGGTSYAAIKLPANSVGHAQLRDNAVTSKEVKNHSLRKVDFKPGQIHNGAPGARGATGPAGAAGPAGPAGAPATALWAVVRADGSLVRGSNVETTNRAAGGTYSVTFNRSVVACADLVNLGGWTNGGEVNVPGSGEAEAGVAGNGTAVADKTVNVFTRDSGGNLGDRGFHLAVLC
jgi:hypothetical protein